MSEVITTSFYKSTLFRVLFRGFSSEDSEIRHSNRNIYFEILQKPKNICQTKTITESDDPLETFILEENKSFLFEKKISDITIFCISSDNLNLFTYLIKNYPLEVVLDDSFIMRLRTGFGGLPFRTIPTIFGKIINVDFFEVILEVYPNFFNDNYIHIEDLFIDNFFHENRCDIIEYLTSKLPEEKIQKMLIYKTSYLYFREKCLDCFQILIRKFPNFFNVFQKNSIICVSFELLKIFRFLGLLNKINTNSLYKMGRELTPDIEQFFKDCKHEFYSY